MQTKWIFLTVVAASLAFVGCSTEQAVTKKVVPVASQPVVDVARAQDDFEFPAEPPKLSRGQKVYQTQCAACHAPGFWQQARVRDVLTFTTPIDGYLMLSRGGAPKVTLPSDERRQLLPASHPSFRQTLSRDDRWAALFYARYLAGAADIKYTSKDGKPIGVDSIYGGNCAVCHGKRGFADGPLHSGHASSHELAGAKTVTGLFNPPPANFHEYKRLYNRTDAQMYRYIVQGIYPSGMPPWLGRVDKDLNYVWDDKLIWMLVRHERTFAYDNDLGVDVPAPAGPIPAYTVPARHEPLGSGYEGSNYEAVRQLSTVAVDGGDMTKSGPVQHGGKM
jgi:mono/diheme cytochrome c family protein